MSFDSMKTERWSNCKVNITHYFRKGFSIQQCSRCMSRDSRSLHRVAGLPELSRQLKRTETIKKDWDKNGFPWILKSQPTSILIIKYTNIMSDVPSNRNTSIILTSEKNGSLHDLSARIMKQLYIDSSLEIFKNSYFLKNCLNWIKGPAGGEN